MLRFSVGVHSISSTEDEENLIDENETPWLTKPSNIKGNRTNSRMNLPSPPPVQYRFKWLITQKIFVFIRWLEIKFRRMSPILLGLKPNLQV